MEEEIQIQSRQQSFQMQIYDSNLSSTEEFQSSEKNIPLELQIIPIKVHKSIVKSKRYQRKGFVVKKQFEVVPILTKQIQSAAKYLLFGFQEIETYYKDYSDPYDFDLTSQLNCIQQVELVENNKTKNELQIFLNNQGSSGITDFNFLINHFSRFTTQDYHKLQHIQDIKTQLNQRLVSLEDIQQSREDFLQFVDNFVKLQIDQGNYFYAYQLYMIDIDRMDINTDRRCVSLSLMSLLGVEPEDYRLLLFNQLNSFQITFGKDRLNNILDSLDMIVNNKLSITNDYQMCTIDDIVIPTKESFEIVHWKERPKWASTYDYTIIFQKFDITADQIQHVINERSQKTEIQVDEEFKESIKLEYVIQSEIFIEKFYPDLYKQLLNKKSVKLIILNEENNVDEGGNQILID
ncbi:hypothetical protein TTHERM_00355390 (macronuclear) [Tetrahymena thermophila SB210]|uniref:Uncharacterized protein n=1 Tax=Tetrahymena thermophila (strain SB210) TaxID=312017 RepID=Q22Y32_TETTS|nr:hypothetical protein TTHERM_00355390 [Tetrahymena thermophila SB210]EAR90192.2 hypothetical protein TTHERM_00355390 [Tetrahymena thermophila SB210]|eukprot:XP_001010437.2 hypothetical protein TTHERM_00355390 [Tetrahymena thermophila SB210]